MLFYAMDAVMAQVDPAQAAEVVKNASNQGWAFGMLCTVMIATFGGLAYLVKTNVSLSYERELRMAARIDKLENEDQKVTRDLATEVTKALVGVTAAVGELTASSKELTKQIERSPCLLTAEEKELAAKGKGSR